MLKTQITGAKYLSPQTNQMTNLNIAVPADSKDTEFGTSDILLAKDVVKLGENSPQIQAIKENIDTVNNTLNDVNSDISELKNKVSKISTELFKIVTELPEAADADKNKIYCILTVNQVDNENKYVEYIAIEEDSVWKWEKIGEFKAEPDLSGYAKLSGATFTGVVKSLNFEASNALRSRFLSTIYVTKDQETYLKAEGNESPTKVFATDGSIADLSTKADSSDLNNCAKLNGTNTFSGNNTFTAEGNVQISFLKCDNIRKTNKGYLFDLDDASRNDHTTYTNDGGKADIGTAEWLKFTLEDGTIVNKAIRVLKNTVTPAT